MIKPQNRRNFLKSAAFSVASLGSLVGLTSCASFDDFFFDDDSDLSQEVVIIGGGLSGLYLASQLKQRLIKFRIFESSSYLGGRIRSVQGQDLGASLIKKSDEMTNQLIDQLKIERTWIDKNHFYLPSGFQSVIDVLEERTTGLLPYYSVRLRWRLIEITPLKKGYELIFQNPTGQKKVICQNLVLSLPPSQWRSVKGLMDLPEMQVAQDPLRQIESENVIKFILPTSAANNGSRGQLLVDTNYLQLRQIFKKTMQGAHLEIDVKHLSNSQFSIDYIYNEIRRRLQINMSAAKLSQETNLNWAQVAGIQGAFFKWIKTPEFVFKSHLKVMGDSVSLVSPHTVEGALQSAQRVAQTFV